MELVVRLGGSLQIHAHMLRHSAAYKLANDGRDTRSLQGGMGHKIIQDTANTPRWWGIA